MRKNYLLLTIFTAFVMAGLNVSTSIAASSALVKDTTSKSQSNNVLRPKPDDNWAIALHLGNTYINGDIDAKMPGPAFGINVRKSFGHVVSARIQAINGTAYGLSHYGLGGPGDEKVTQANYSLSGRPDANGVLTPNYIGVPFYENYRNNYWDVSLQLVANANNLNFYNRQNKWNLYGFVGGGMVAYKLAINALDANGNIYDFSNVETDNKSNAQIKNQVKDVLDDTYETKGHEFFVKNKNRIPTFQWTGGIGVQRYINNRFSVGLEHKLTRVVNDYYDNRLYRSIFNDIASTTDYDYVSFTNLNIEMRLGKNKDVDSRWWSNPLLEPLDQIADNTSKIKQATSDGDKDGVADIFDLEPDTPEGATVDTHGVMIDTDKDGVPDYLDIEPFSLPGAMVDKTGKMIDTDGDGVPDNLDAEVNSPNSGRVDAKGVSIKENSARWFLPMIFFDLDKDVIKPESYTSLKQVAQVMNDYPDLKVDVIGNTDVRASEQYNVGLSRRRAQNAINHLVTYYGIDPRRLNIKYEGENNNLYKNAKREPAHAVNRRVEFRVAN